MAPTGNDANPGTLASPWLTIQKAANTVPAGATVYLRTGTYVGATITHSGTSTAPVTFTAYPGEQPVVSGDSNHTKVLLVYGAHDIVISDLTVSNAPAQWGAGIYVQSGAYDVTIQGNTLSYNNSFGVKLDTVNQVTVRDNDITRNETGIEVTSAGDGVLIADNRIYLNDRMVVNTVGGNDDRGAVAVNLYHTTGHLTATGNTIWGNRAYSYDYGTDGGAFEIYAASNVTITDNVAWDNDDVVETGTDGTAPCDSNTITRNIAYGGKGVATVPGPAVGLILRCASNTLVANNTFYGLDSFVYDVTASAQSFGGSIDGLRIENNVALSTGPKVYSIDSALPSSVTIDRDLAWNSSGGYIGYVYGHGNTSSLATVTSWTGIEKTGIQADPGFVDGAAADFDLASGSPAIDRGLLIPGVTDGYLGGGPDLGRYECW